MAGRTFTFTAGEWYHCYSRTIDKSRPFETEVYAQRFLETLYLANNTGAMPNIPDLMGRMTHDEIFSVPRERPLVAVGCYCLMPTHYHLLIQPLIDTGISEYLHKVGTSFNRFFNEHEDRIGNLFIKPFRAKHIGTDEYLERVVSYVHCNPVELFEPQWKKGVVRQITSLKKKLRGYELSSLKEHEGGKRPESSILNLNALGNIRENGTNLQKILTDAREYYQFLEFDL